MKKDIEWLKKEIATEMIELEHNRNKKDGDLKYQTLRSVAEKIYQLDEPEVLSQEWIDKNVVHVRGLGHIIEAEVIENLIVPKQEELESKIKVLIEAYKQEEDAYSNPENGWISGFIEDLKNLVEEEQKYYVSARDEEYGGFWFLSKNNSGDISIGVNRDWSEVDWESLKLTEEEIKDYDSRYWAFAKPVEEMEE